MSTGDNAPIEGSPDELPALQSEHDLTYHTSPADPSSEDPITRSVMSGQLDGPSDKSGSDPPTLDPPNLSSASSENDKPSSPISHTRGGSTMRGDSGSGPALSVLNLLRGRGQLASDGDEDDEDEEDDDEEMGGTGSGLSASPLGMGPMSLMRGRGATGDTMKKELKVLHPYATILGPSDVESCLRLERAVFEEGHAASREKIRYRLLSCGELSLGIFSSSAEEAKGGEEEEEGVLRSPTAETANRVESSFGKRKGVLLGAIVATKTQNKLVVDEDMMLPNGVEGSKADEGRQEMKKGHDEAGRTIALHSLAVVPDYQKVGLGQVLLKSYIQRMMEADVADRIALLTWQRLIPFYAKLGFENKGKSDVQYGGGGWINMVLEFASMKKGDGGDDDE